MARLDDNGLEVRTEPTGQRELRELMGSFNQMAVSIHPILAQADAAQPDGEMIMYDGGGAVQG